MLTLFFLLWHPLSDVWWLPTNRHRTHTNRHRLHTNRHRLPTNRHRLPTNRHRLPTGRHRRAYWTLRVFFFPLRHPLPLAPRPDEPRLARTCLRAGRSPPEPVPGWTLASALGLGAVRRPRSTRAPRALCYIVFWFRVRGKRGDGRGCPAPPPPPETLLTLHSPRLRPPQLGNAAAQGPCLALWGLVLPRAAATGGPMLIEADATVGPVLGTSAGWA